MALGANIRKLRTSLGLRLEDVSLASGVDVGTISALENRDSARSKYASDIAHALGTTVEELSGRDVPTGANIAPGPTQHGPYPLISKVQAGNWTELVDNLAPGDAISRHHSAHNLGPSGYLLRVAGDSMTNPAGPYSFPAGMLLHVNPGLEPRPGQFVVVRRNGNQEATFKRYVVLDGEPYLEAINPDWPRELRFLKLQPGDDWCGVVVDASLGDLP